MPVFSYKALDQLGQPTKGVVEADSLRAARAKLKTRGVFATQIAEIDTQEKKGLSFSGIRFRRKVDSSTLSVGTRQLATLLGAGMPLVESLKALSEQMDNLELKKIIVEVGTQVNQGQTLASALAQHPSVFPRLYVNLVASGEASGTLEIVLSRLADLMESQNALRRKVTSAMVYPILMLVLCFGVVVILLTYVVPQITHIYAAKKAILPLPTRVVIGASNFFKKYFFLILIVLILSGYLLRKLKNSERGRKAIDRLMLRLPLIKNLTLKIAAARFARNLGTMLESGIELLTALSIAKNVVGNSQLEEAVALSAEGVREGRSLSRELGARGVFPSLLIHMTAIGEKTGELEDLLLRTAQAFENEVSALVSGLTSLLEPLLILALAIIVGGILAAVMLPMLELSNLAGAG